MTRNNTILLWIFATFVILALVSSRYLLKVQGPKDQTNFEKEFGMVFTDYDGHAVHLYDFRRKVIVAYAWASWCTYCAQELQNLGTLKQKYGNDIQVLAVNRAEPRPIAKEYTDKLTGVSDIKFLLDPSDSFFKSIDGYAMPETAFINSKGAIVYRQRGPLQMDDAAKKVEEALK